MRDRSGIRSLQGSTMGTTWNVQVGSGTEDALQQTSADIQALLYHLDREIFSTWNPDSELSLLNRSQPGQAQPVSVEMLTVLRLSKQLYDTTHGTFDISVGALVNAWGFGPQTVAGVPDAAMLAAAKAQQGLAALSLDEHNHTITLHKPLALDLSAIAKGHAVDKVADLLLAQGHHSFLVEIGGELRLQGLRPNGEPWIIAVEAPQSGLTREVYARLNSRGEALALAGSGDYRNFREVAGQRYSHEIDPRTGYPIRHDLTAVTVISKTAAVADAWATALMVLGPEAGPELASSEELAAYFIMRGPAGLEHRQTSAFERFLYED